jgi:hypothetical protein
MSNNSWKSPTVTVNQRVFTVTQAFVIDEASRPTKLKR